MRVAVVEEEEEEEEASAPRLSSINDLIGGKVVVECEK